MQESNPELVPKARGCTSHSSSHYRPATADRPRISPQARVHVRTRGDPFPGLCSHDILLLVLLRNPDVLPAFLQLVGCHLAQDLHVLDEEQLQATLFQVVLSRTQEARGRCLPYQACPHRPDYSLGPPTHWGTRNSQVTRNPDQCALAHFLLQGENLDVPYRGPRSSYL